MESIQSSIQNLNMPQHIKMRMQNLTQNQLKKNYNTQESLQNKSKEYKCSKCRDLRYIIENDEAIPCECKSLREAEDILKNSGISEGFRKKTFQNFNYNHNINLLKAYTSATKYVKDFYQLLPSRNNSIMFLGQVGSGKTHLSMAISNILMDNGIGVLYMPYRESIIKLKQNIMDSEYYNREISRFKNAKVLFIDDLFKGSISGSDINTMFEIINHRYFNGLPVIVSCEKTVDALLNIDEAIGSRLVEMCEGHVVEIKDKKLNYRVNK